MATSVTTTDTSSESKTHSTSQSQSQSQSQSETHKVLDEALMNKILSGLMGYMTDEEISSYAESLLKPTLNAGLESAEQQYAATELAKQQEIKNIAAALDKSIEGQETAYQKSMANVETAALARGMGRSSYTLQSLANQGDALAKAIETLSGDASRQQQQIQEQISLAAQQKAQTTGRLNTDYASNLAAKIQELRQQQRQEYNSNYLTAVSGSMGSASTGSQQTQGSSVSDSETKGSSHSVSVTSTGGGGRRGSTTYGGQA